MIDIPDSVFASDEQGQLLCPRCHKRIADCDCPDIKSPVSKSPIQYVKPVIRIEKSGRSGKTVTIVERLKRDEVFLKQLSKVLKGRVGGGGTYYIDVEKGGVIELQGDHRELLQSFNFYPVK